MMPPPATRPEACGMVCLPPGALICHCIRVNCKREAVRYIGYVHVAPVCAAWPIDGMHAILGKVRGSQLPGHDERQERVKRGDGGVVVMAREAANLAVPGVGEGGVTVILNDRLVIEEKALALGMPHHLPLHHAFPAAAPVGHVQKDDCGVLGVEES